MSTNVVPIRASAKSSQTKLVGANQKEIDKLELNSGTWRVQGIPGLYVRCRKTTRTYFVQRRVAGVLVREYLDSDLTIKQAKAEASKKWTSIKPKAAPAGVLTLGDAIDQYVEHRQTIGYEKTGKKMSPKTAEIAKYNMDRYLSDWKTRALEDVARDEMGIAALHDRILKGRFGDSRPGKRRKKGPRIAAANQVIRLLKAVHTWFRKRNRQLPEWPSGAAEVYKIAARNWAYSPDALRAWWSAPKKDKSGEVVTKDGAAVLVGVNSLGVIKRLWWLTALLTGARKASIEALRWQDIDFEKKLIHFAIAKGGHDYHVPLSEKLAELLTAYHRSEDVPPSDWVFPSPVRSKEHIVAVKDDAAGAGPAHRLRHTFKTTLTMLGATPEQAKLLMGHSLGTDVSAGYLSAGLVIESLRPITNAVAQRYVEILGSLDVPKK